MALPGVYLRGLIRNPWVLAACSCLVVAGTSSLIAHYIWRADMRAAQDEFRQTATDTSEAIEKTIWDYEQRIGTLAMVTNARGMTVATRDWQALTGQLKTKPGQSDAVSLSLVRYVAAPPPYPLQRLPAQLQAEDMPGFSARIIAIDRDRAGDSLIGRDLNLDAIRQEALVAARDSGNVAITSPVILARDHHVGATPGFLLIAPVYAGGLPTTMTERRAQIIGYVVAAHRMRDLLNPLLPRLGARIALTISDPSDGYTPLIYFETDEPNPNALFQDGYGLLMADRVWQLSYQTLPDYEQRLHRQHSARIVMAGVLLALLVGSLVWRLARSWRLAEREVHGVSGELRRYQSLLRTVIDVIPEPVLVKDANLKLILVNQAYADRAGKPIADLLGKEAHEQSQPGLAPRLLEADHAVFAGEGAQLFEMAMPNSALKAVRSYIVTKRLARDTDGQPIMVGMDSDVTELRRAIAQFQAIIEQTPLVAVQGFNRNCVLTHWNMASEHLFGVTAKRALGSRLQDLLLRPRLQRMFEHIVEDAWLHHKTFGPRLVGLRLPDKRKLWLWVTLFPVIQDGRVVELFSMAVDVSARHEAERQLALHRDNLQRLVDERTAGLLQTKQALELALHARSEFLANMSHELRTPMHAVLSFARLGEERSETGAHDKLRDYFSRIALSGERLLTLINNLLDLSKLEAGKMMLELHETDLAELAAEVVAELELLAAGKSLTIALVPSVDAARICVDRERMRQVLSNLLSNAIRFSPEGGRVELSVSADVMRIGRRATDSSGRSALRLAVADQGPGIPPDELEFVFDKFAQSSTTRTGAGGTGLGLAICREIVHAHQGTITASNRAEGGAVFEVLLPYELHEPGAD